MKLEIIANQKGYSVTEEGDVLSPRGGFRKLSLLNKGSGYLRFNIRDEGKIKGVFVHRLQAYQKFGLDMYKENFEVRHKNGISTDNSHNNILIGTHSENMMDRLPKDRLKSSLHATSFHRKFNKEEVKDFHNKNGKSYKLTMQTFNMSSKGTLNYILNN